MKNRIALSLVFIIFFFSCSKKISPDKNSEVKNGSEKINSDSVLPSSIWKELPRNAYQVMNLKSYRLFSLDSLAMQKLLSRAPLEKHRDMNKVILEIPLPDQGFMKFNIFRTTTMDSSLEAAFPLLKTYGGNGIDDKTASIRLDFNSNGFHANVISQSGEWLIQPAAHGITHQYLLCFYKQDVLIRDRKPFELPDSLKR